MRAYTLVLSILLTSIPGLGTAQNRSTGKGQGAIVIRDDAPLYADATGDTVKLKTNAGDWVAGITTLGGIVMRTEG